MGRPRKYPILNGPVNDLIFAAMKRPLWIREYTCPQCGALLHRDVAAAINVLAKARTEPSGMDTAWAVP